MLWLGNWLSVRGLTFHGRTRIRSVPEPASRAGLRYYEKEHRSIQGLEDVAQP